jgi:uncharacterized protein (UPF0332 family)
MPFDWNQYLTLAKTLSQRTTDEAALRSAVSRSYYSAFMLALQRAELSGYRDKSDATGGSHQLVWRLYGRNATSADCLRLAALGPRLRRRRIKADYKSEYPKLSEEVGSAIADADECVALLARLPVGVPEDTPRSWSV